MKMLKDDLKVYPLPTKAVITNTNNDDFQRVVTFVLLGVSKPVPGKEQSGELQINLITKTNPLNKDYRQQYTEIKFSYFDALSVKHYRAITIPLITTTIEQFAGCFDLLLSIEGYDDNKVIGNLAGFTKEIHKEFINRLITANKNPKFSSRFKAAANIGTWGA